MLTVKDNTENGPRQMYCGRVFDDLSLAGTTAGFVTRPNPRHL